MENNREMREGNAYRMMSNDMLISLSVIGMIKKDFTKVSLDSTLANIINRNLGQGWLL